MRTETIGDCTMATIQDLIDSVGSLRHLPRVIEIVDALNDRGMEATGQCSAAFVGNAGYLAIVWGETVLWDSEGSHQFDLDYDYGEENEPTLELCCFGLRNEAKGLIEAFGSDHY